MSKEFSEINLKFPIEVDASNGTKQKISGIRLGRLKAKHLELLPENLDTENSKVQPKDMIPLIAGLSGLTVENIGELDFVDLIEVANKLTEVMGEFESRETGES